MQLSIFSLVEPPANPFRSQAYERDWTIRGNLALVYLGATDRYQFLHLSFD